MASSRNFPSQFAEIWSRLEKSQRATIVLLALLALVAIGSFVYYMNRIEYEVLYRDLNPEDAQAIAAKLKEEKKDFLVQGTSILVAAPKSEVDKLRLEVAGAGLARSGRVGYEIFDKNQFGLTDFTEQVNLQRALEGELARTISSLTEISEARVHLVLPKDSVFEDKREDAKASVVVRLRNGADLSKPSIAGIKGVVAGAVPGLRTYNVSVVDDQGRLLSQSAETGDQARSELESGIKEQIEHDMVSKVISILEPVVGKGKVHANASVDLDFNTTEQTEETFNPNPQAILSQQRTEERVSSASTESGVPGTQSNVSGSAAQQPGTAPARLRTNETTNYEVSKLVRHTVQPKGNVRRISVAVILDHKAAYSKSPEGKVVTTNQPRTQAELDAYRELVLAAVGFSKERGDTVTLENVAFYTESRPVEEAPPAPWHVKYQTYIVPGMKYVSFLVLFLLLYLFLFRPVRARVLHSIAGTLPAGVHEAASQLAPEASQQHLHEAHHAEESVAAGAEHPALPGHAEESEIKEEPLPDLESLDDQIERELLREVSMVDTGGRKTAILRKKLVDRAKREPEMISQLIRSWIQERA
jgi:flagellar M-ring protein FliF